MQEYNIATIVGSLRKDSFNRKLANAISKIAPNDFNFIETPIKDLSLYNQDDDDNQSSETTKFKSEIAKSQAVLFVTPEYNRSIPGVLKNAIDHASRPYGKSVWKGKPGGILGISPGAIGTALAQSHLRQVLTHLSMPIMGQPEAFLQLRDGMFDDNGNLALDTKKYLQSWMDSFVAWVKLHSN